jgi:hypothetical protein
LEEGGHTYAGIYLEGLRLKFEMLTFHMVCVRSATVLANLFGMISPSQEDKSRSPTQEIWRLVKNPNV